MNTYEKEHNRILEKQKKGENIPLLKVIRHYCLHCCGYYEGVTKTCTADDCVLHPYRMGRNPFLKRKKLSQKQLTALKKGRDEALIESKKKNL